MRRLHPSLVSWAALGLLVSVAAPARAQWYVEVFSGGAHTQPATVSITEPAQGLSVEYHDVVFRSKPYAADPYFGASLGRMLGKSRRLGVEFELIHLKVVADTSQTYVTTPGPGGATIVTSFATMRDTVQRYQMTHGLNFALANLVLRVPLRPGSDRVMLDVRAGAGPTIAHGETTVLGESRDGYGWGGVGADAGVGVQIRLNGRIALMTGYQVTVARPTLALAHGTGRATALSHHAMGGLTIALTR